MAYFTLSTSAHSHNLDDIYTLTNLESCTSPSSSPPSSSSSLARSSSVRRKAVSLFHRVYGHFDPRIPKRCAVQISHIVSKVNVATNVGQFNGQLAFEDNNVGTNMRVVILLRSFSLFLITQTRHFIPIRHLSVGHKHLNHLKIRVIVLS